MLPTYNSHNPGSHPRRPQPGVHPNRGAIRILLIEDNRSDVFLVSRMLRDTGSEFDIIDIPRLVDALDQLSKASFDIALLDLNLLDMEGVASVAALHTQAPAMPIIVYSGTDEPSIREKALVCGARHFLVKGRESAFSLRFMIQQSLGMPA
jgi:DNA-binding response OmpR family regulator